MLHKKESFFSDFTHRTEKEESLLIYKLNNIPTCITLTSKKPKAFVSSLDSLPTHIYKADTKSSVPMIMESSKTRPEK